jgi:tetratricopeptide (TPR) repeat protein
MKGSPNSVDGAVAGGRYRLESRLGEGGMGAVYRATDLRSGEQVALKRMTEPRRRRVTRALLRFQREFYTLVALHHPRIIRAFDYGVDETGPFYTMELLGGQDLRDVMKERDRLPPREACLLLRDVASALAAVHARGLVHRDLSARNVRVIDGRAKLFDFGVLVNVGWVGDVAGTPAYVAPEMLRGLAVDGRVDLYSLGVLAYRMLTGTLPYDVRDMDELEARWAAPVVPPSTLAPVPEALEDLVLDLLCLEPLGRPASAAVLIERLTAIGSLEPDPQLAVTPGFTESAALVGRETELGMLAKLLGATQRGEACAFVVEAESGAGKSRLLQELGIRAKLEGALALRVSCEEAEGGPFAALDAVIDEAFAAAPEAAVGATRDDAPLLGRVFDSVRRAHPNAAPAAALGEPAEDRMRLQAAVVRAMRRLAEHRPVVLLVDDVQRCDEASAAAFAGLARADVPRLLLGFARRLNEPIRAPAAVESLSSIEPQLQLRGLEPAGVKALLRSVFGDVPHLSRLSRWMHEATGGSPLFCAAMTRHLVEAEVVRHDGSSWVLPEEVTRTGLPDGLAAAMQQRVAALPDGARAVAELLAVHGVEARVERAVALIDTPDLTLPGRGAPALFDAVQQLVQQGVLSDDGEKLRFRHDSFREALLASIEPERRRRLHRHIGEVLLAAGVGDDPRAQTELGWHLYRGGEEQRGAAMLERAGRRLYQAQALADCIAPLSKAREVRERLGAPAAVIADLSFMLLTSGWVSDRRVGAIHSERPLDLYADLSGLSAARRLRWMGWRLALLLGMLWAALRWLFRRGEARGPNPVLALSRFAMGLANATAIAYSANQKARVRALVARAEPLRAFKGHPPFAAYVTLQAMTDILQGRMVSAAENLTQANRLATRPRFNPLSLDERRLADAATRSMRIIIDVNQFNPRLHEDLAAIDASGLVYYQHAAESIRAVHHRYRGEEAKAREIEARIETTSLQLGAWSLDLQRLLFAHPAYSTTHDVEGLKRCLEALERRVEEGMELSVRVVITRAELYRELGDFDTALRLLDPLLERLDPDDYLFRQWGASAAAQAALESYRYEIAARYAGLGLDAGADPNVQVLLPHLRCQRVMGLVEEAVGRPQEAVARLDRAISLAEAHRCPVQAGELHEARARVAFSTGDRLEFELHRIKCAQWLRPTENPGLIAVVERLAELDRLDRVSTETGSISESSVDSIRSSTRDRSSQDSNRTEPPLETEVTAASSPHALQPDAGETAEAAEAPTATALPRSPGQGGPSEGE